MNSRILITDDHAENCYFLEILLQGNGFTTVTAANGQEALAIALADPPDLIVSDILMPIMDGFSLCRQWRSHEFLKGIPFVYYTATYTDQKDIAFGLSLGAKRYLLKPMEPDALLQALTEVLAESRDGEPGQGEEESLRTSDMEMLKRHNESLFHKLEKKMTELESANLQLQREVSERQAIEASLRQSEEKLRLLLDTLPIGLALADGQDSPQYFNRLFTSWFGHPCEAPPTVAGWLLQASDDEEAGRRYASAWQKGVALSQETGREVSPFDIRAICRDGVPRDFVVSGAVVADVHITILTNITERKQLEQRLLQACKLENIGNLAGGIAHDFNNVLTSISGFAGLLQLKLPKGDPLREYVDEIALAGTRGASLTQQLLAFSRKQILDVRPLDLNKILTNLQRMMQRLIREDITLTLKCCPSALPIQADANQIEQVVINLVTNARDAMSSGGPLNIATQITNIDADFIKIYGEGEIGPYAVLTVSDAGAGMDEETLQKIYEPFFTTKDPGKGTGLGLPVAYGIIKQHRGMIHVESKQGEGSTFTVYLPLLSGEVGVEEVARREATLLEGSETVLAAEDNEMLRKLTGDILTHHGYTVHLAEDGRRALDLFREHQGEIDIVVLDMIMPGMGGIEAYGEIFKIAPETKILFVTGYGDGEPKSPSGKSLPLLMKPYTPLCFLQTLRRLLDEAMAAG